MGVLNCSPILIGMIVVVCTRFVGAQRDPIPKIQVVDGGLSPPYFNLADNRRIYASGILNLISLCSSFILQSLCVKSKKI